MKKTKGEAITEELFKSYFEVECEQIHPKPNQKNADFYLKIDGKIIAVCEVEDIQFTRPSEETGWTKNEYGVFSRDVNDVSRIGKKVQRAFPQLKDYTEPKILIIVDFDHIPNPLDSLGAAVTGVGGDERIIITETLKGLDVRSDSRHVAKGRIKNMVKGIDIYFWIDGMDKKIVGSRCFDDNSMAKELQRLIWGRKNEQGTRA